MRQARQAVGLRARRRSHSSTHHELLQAMVRQALHGSKGLGHHLRMITGKPISDSAAIQRRATLDWPFFHALFGSVLKPLAQPQEQPGSFYQGLRLLAVDGTQCSLPNSVPVLGLKRQRPRNQHSDTSAFMKWSAAVLIELGTHQPLGVACSTCGEEREEGEIAIARRTLSALPSKGANLLLGDRLYGCASFMLDVQQHSARTHCLMRVRSNVLGKPKCVLSDGSLLVQARSESQARAGAASHTLMVREVRGQLQRPGKALVELRLWTTLLDEKAHPGETLLRLYAQRWEQELLTPLRFALRAAFGCLSRCARLFRQLKAHLGASNLLRAQSEGSAQAEFAAMILAASVVAAQRVQSAGESQQPPLRLSVAKVRSLMLHCLEGMRDFGHGLSQRQRQALARKWQAIIAREALIPPRRARQCERALRRTKSKWPLIKSRGKPDPTVVLTPIYCSLA